MGRTTGFVASSRKALLKAMAKNDSRSAHEQVVPFSNNDVPKFLKRLNKLEEQAKNTRFKVG